MISKFRRCACIGLTCVFAASMIAGNVLAFAGTSGTASVSELYDSLTFENVTGKIDLSSIALQNLSSSVLENNTSVSSVSGRHTLIVSLDEPAVLESKNSDETVAEYINTYAGQRTLANVKSSQETFLANLTAAGVNYKYKTSFNTILNAVAIEADVSAIEKIKSVASVTSVVFSETYAYPEAITTSSSDVTTNPSNVYSTGIYDSSSVIDEYGVDGSGMTVAILDTGLDYTHEAFNVMPEVYSLTKSDVEEAVRATKTNSDGTISAALNAVSLSALNGKNITADDLYINEKVPFAYDYADKDADVYPSYSQHGVHVAGIVAGQADSYTDKDGNLAVDSEGNKISFRGVAPNAQLVICKVFTDDLDSSDLGGAVTEDIVAALEDCVTLGVDIINMSLGTTAGFSSISIDGDTEGELLNRTYESIKAEGINLITAASNEYSSGYGGAFGTNLASNPDSGTVGSPSTFTGAVSVASINGQLSRYIMVEDGDSLTPIYYEEASDANSVAYNFLEEMNSRYPEANGRFKYVVISGIGSAGDYTSSIKSILTSGEPVIAVVKRGTSTFLDKVDAAMRAGAAGVIIYNNVAGTVRMNLGEIENPVPTVSVTMDAGAILTKVGQGGTGYIRISDEYQAGPFMNDYSSWGSTPDLKLKPDVTAHGGEITSTVSGGYAEMSGTSMASPNLAGFVALLRSYLKTNEKYASLIADMRSQYGLSEAEALTRLTNQIVMSSAETVYDKEGLPYSPRKQGAGLATLASAFSTNALLYTESEENDFRPKIELGEDEAKNGVYNLTFHVRNFGSTALTFKAQSIFMTETIASDGLAVAEQAYLLDDIAAVWTMNGKTFSDGDTVTVPTGADYEINVKLTLSDAEKAYIDKYFVNGMYIEGFIRLVSEGEQCTLNLPFMGFYGDWEAAPMLDYDCYEISEFLQDTSYDDETRPQASVWATQGYANYYNDKYVIPLGNFVYIQDEAADQIYTNAEYAAISCYNEYYGENETGNYMTTTGIKAVYAGLLRNAEVVTYDLYNAETGELIRQDEVYRVGKAVAGGGSATPAQVLLDFTAEDLGLVANGKYAMDFHFYLKASDKDDPEKQNDGNTFSMIFYVDYEAPVLVDARIRYSDYKDGTKDKQYVYLDLDIYDNHYPQAVLLCYADEAANTDAGVSLYLATEYITPVYNPVKNGITTVSIPITDIYAQIGEYQNRLYVELDDYALNHSVFSISFTKSNSNLAPNEFEITENSRVTSGVSGKELTLSLYESYKVSLDYNGDGNLSNFTWTSSRPDVVAVKNGELFGKSAGTSTITILGSGGAIQRLTVTVTDSSQVSLPVPTISFGLIKSSTDSLVKASGLVEVNAGSDFKLDVIVEPWYYPTALNLRWESSDETLATVDQNGNVSVTDQETGKVTITAVVINDSGVATLTAATVQLDVQDAFTVSNYSLTKYHGRGGVVKIPDDENIMTIGEEAFKDNDNITAIIIPKTVTTISERAFINCTALEYIYFVDTVKIEPATGGLTLISANAFNGCTALKVLDLSNCKTIAVARNAFAGCTSLEEIVDMENIGTAYDYAFLGCTKLKDADITGLHVAGMGVFAGCTSLESVETAYYSAIGEYMFYGCTLLEEVEIFAPTVGEGAFLGCTSLGSVTFSSDGSGKPLVFNIGARAFYNCSELETVNFNGLPVSKIGDQAFADCTSLTSFTLPAGETQFGDQVFGNTPVTFTADSDHIIYNGAVYSADGKTLIIAPETIDSSFTFRDGVEEIGAYAFSCSTFTGVTSLTIPSTVTIIGEGAFAHTTLTSVTLPDNLTEIPAYLFYGGSLTSVTVPASVTAIGEGAFEGNTNLSSVTFAAGSALKSIGNLAFANCRSLTEIDLPDGAAQMGSYVFYYCSSLVTANLPSVTVLGSYTFEGCVKLETVTFGENASVTGDYTFFTGYGKDSIGNIITDEYGYPMYINANSLKSVTLGNATTAIGDGVFYYCSSLASIDLKNVTEVGENAFSNCYALATVNGMENLVKIGGGAFYFCTALGGTLNLSSAVTIGDEAFYALENITGITMPNVKSIGSFAFYGCRELSVNLPASLESVGDGAFAYSLSLGKISVDENNPYFFADETGALYRYVTNFVTGRTYYELCAYPSAKVSGTYTIKEGTVSVQAYAFAGLASGAVDTVVFTYAVKTIGSGAFYMSGISTYDFQCINAPTLITEYLGDNDLRSLYYINFEDALYDQLDTSNWNSTSALAMRYPSNGSGYDNFVYSKYFATAVKGAAIMDDTTRELSELIESILGIADAEAVAGWLTLDVNAENTAKVSGYSEMVKEAHRIYNTITDKEQLTFLGEESVNALFAIEEALKPVKTRFGITVTPVSLTISPDSTHKTNYVKGETFDMTGLILIVTYDDYSTEIADMSLISIVSGYDGPLSTYDVEVILTGYGKEVRVPITVEGGQDSVGGGTDKSFNPAVIYGPIIGVVVLAAIAVAAVILVKKFKAKKAPVNEASESAENEEE